ncbi:MAG: hypothetical protein HY938_02095 [Nitrosomonadales bacterium]|nr:hypothetical protein [Nitrosomonadales bacterium]
MRQKLNLFIAWFFIPLTLVMGFVAAIGRAVLELLGATTHEGDIPGRMAGALLLFGVVYTVLHFRRSLPPEGNPDGKGYRFGHRLVLAGNLLSGMFIVFQFLFPLVESRDMHLVLNGFTDAFGYWAMAFWVVGFSFLYQSSLPKK